MPAVNTYLTRQLAKFLLKRVQPYYYIKICGLTNLADATRAAEKGCDFLGMVFHPQSKRACTVEAALQIKENFMSKPRVLVFAYDEYDYIIDIYQQLRDMLTFIQVPADHPAFDRLKELLTPMRMIPVLHIGNEFDQGRVNDFKNFSIMIFDTASPAGPEKMAGGTGQVFNWSLVKEVERPYLLAGGLNPENICQAIGQVDPFGFDVASGIEASAGTKDQAKMNDFIEKVRNSEKHCN